MAAVLWAACSKRGKDVLLTFAVLNFAITSQSAVTQSVLCAASQHSHTAAASCLLTTATAAAGSSTATHSCYSCYSYSWLCYTSGRLLYSLINVNYGSRDTRGCQLLGAPHEELLQRVSKYINIFHICLKTLITYGMEVKLKESRKDQVTFWVKLPTTTFGHNRTI